MRLFPPGAWWRWPALYTLLLCAAHYAALAARRRVDFDCPPHWPLSIFNFRTPRPADWVWAGITVLLGGWLIGRVTNGKATPALVALAATLLVCASNAVQGVPKGFANPVAGGISPQQYYHDAARVASPLVFLSAFNRIQPGLGIHARTHPPGATMLFWAGRGLTGNRPALVALLLAALATPLTAWAFPRLLRALFGDNPPAPQPATLLLLLLPAVQIYYCATLDAVIAALLLCGVALLVGGGRWWHCAGGIGCVVGASFLTFGFAWVLPLLAVLLIRRERGSALALLAATLAGFYLALYATTGFDYLAALRTASRLENPQGFRLLYEPVSYAVTRLEDISEPAVFLGPFLVALLWRGLPPLRAQHPDAFFAFAAATGTLALLFLTGAYHTGETARACVFIVPYLLLPVLPPFARATPGEQRTLLAVVLAQSVLMQLLGNYFW